MEASQNKICEFPLCARQSSTNVRGRVSRYGSGEKVKETPEISCLRCRNFGGKNKMVVGCTANSDDKVKSFENFLRQENHRRSAEVSGIDHR